MAYNQAKGELDVLVNKIQFAINLAAQWQPPQLLQSPEQALS